MTKAKGKDKGNERKCGEVHENSIKSITRTRTRTRKEQEKEKEKEKEKGKIRKLRKVRKDNP